MASATIGNMTVEELKRLILDLMEERRQEYMFGYFDSAEADAMETDEMPDKRTLQEVFESIEGNRWTPPPETPSPSQMIREDRDAG
jgi:hypothetical protein